MIDLGCKFYSMYIGDGSKELLYFKGGSGVAQS